MMPFGFFRGMLGYLGYKTDQSDVSTSDDTYLGAYSMCVDRIQSDRRHLIATNLHDVDDELLEWCRDRGCKLFWDRVIWDNWMHRWQSNGIGGFDILFILAPDSETGMEAKLAWGGYIDG